MLNLYGLKNCDSCRKAMKALDAAHVPYEFKDVRDQGVTKTQVSRWVKHLGWENVLNTRSTTWRGLSAAEKNDVDEKQAIGLMVDHPTLIKRPLIENGATQVFAGWTKEAQDSVLSG